MTYSYSLYAGLMLGGLLAALVWKASGSLILTILVGAAVGVAAFFGVRALEKVISKKVISATDSMRDKIQNKKQQKQ